MALRALLALTVPVHPSGIPPTLPMAQDPIYGHWGLSAPAPAVPQQGQYPSPTALPSWALLNRACPLTRIPAWPQPIPIPSGVSNAWGQDCPGVDGGWWERPRL